MTQGSTNQDSATTPGALPVGAKLGKYEIVAQLGAGGQSIVYKGYDPLLDRYVAIKQVSPQLAADEAFLGRLREVVRQLARLNCEQVVTIYELIENRAGLFIVMEFVEGRSIESMLAANGDPVEPKAALQIIWRIAAGLSAIHKAGIIHRDIKPGNIMLAEAFRVKITDFGVAARAGVPASMRLGTTKYMAPELFSGEQVDQRADVYSLGVIAYEMLTGREKFNEVFHDVVRDPHSEALRWMKWHSSPDQLAPLLTEASPSVPPALSAIVERMLAKDPHERFQSVEELGREIRANFSPRGLRGGAQGLRRERLSIDAAARAESRAAGEPSDLTVQPEQAEPAGPLTAEIPKEPMSRRKKLAILGVVAGLIMAALITKLVVDDIQNRQYGREAEELFTAAERLYREGARARSRAEKTPKFQQAEKDFARILNDYREKARAAAGKAGVMWYLTKAQISILAGDSKTTADNLAAAEHLNDQLEQRRDEMYDWTQKMDIELDEFRTYWLQQKDYADAMREIREHVAAGDLDEALALLNSKARTSAGLAEQIDQVASLRGELKRREKIEEVRSHIRAGEDLAGKGDVAGAIAAYDKAISVLDAVRDMLPPADYKKLRHEAEDDKTILRTDTEYAKAIAQAKKALRTNNRLVAADAYERAHKLKADQKGLLEKSRQLRHDHYLQEGLRRLGADQISQAEQNLKRAQSYLKSPAVEAAIARVEKAKDFKRIVWQGDRLYRQKNYEGALEKYQQAAKYTPASKEVKGKIDECRYRIALAKAESERNKKEWDKARREYHNAKRAKPDRSAEIDERLRLLAEEQRYCQLMAEAEQARKKRDWPLALGKLTAAKEVRATQEVVQKIKVVRYEEHVQLGDRAIVRGDYAGAGAYYKLAKGFMPTPEIEEKIKRAEQLKAGSGSE